MSASASHFSNMSSTNVMHTTPAFKDLAMRCWQQCQKQVDSYMQSGRELKGGLGIATKLVVAHGAEMCLVGGDGDVSQCRLDRGS